jgi:hypothetical protein
MAHICHCIIIIYHCRISLLCPWFYMYYWHPKCVYNCWGACYILIPLELILFVKCDRVSSWQSGEYTLPWKLLGEGWLQGIWWVDVCYSRTSNCWARNSWWHPTGWVLQVSAVNMSVLFTLKMYTMQSIWLVDYILLKLYVPPHQVR